jgi:hypothetical protein
VERTGKVMAEVEGRKGKCRLEGRVGKMMYLCSRLQIHEIFTYQEKTAIAHVRILSSLSYY